MSLANVGGVDGTQLIEHILKAKEIEVGHSQGGTMHIKAFGEKSGPEW